MNGRTPSFFRLFRRSHYVRPVAWDDPSAEAEAARKDRERFAVAALAFCLKHDPAFLRHFWQGICRVPETDPDIMPPFAADGVLLEPPEWADLRLVSESKTGRYVWVIEVKAGAGLEERQRPDKPHEFENPNSGYGALFAEAEGHAATHLRYIVLGAKEKLDLNSRSRPLGIFVQQRSWDDVSASCPRSPLVQDLFETFGDLGINPFYLEKVKTICVKTGMREARDAWEVLKAVCQDVLDAHPSALKPDGEIRRSGSYGLYINQPPPQRSSKNHRLLKAATSSAGNLAWLGYEFDDAGDVHKSIWFHSENPKKREHLFAKVTKSFPRSEKTQVGGDLFVIVLPNDDDQHNDFEWFERALGCAIA